MLCNTISTPVIGCLTSIPSIGCLNEKDASHALHRITAYCSMHDWVNAYWFSIHTFFSLSYVSPQGNGVANHRLSQSRLMPQATGVYPLVWPTTLTSQPVGSSRGMARIPIFCCLLKEPVKLNSMDSLQGFVLSQGFSVSHVLLAILTTDYHYIKYLKASRTRPLRAIWKHSRCLFPWMERKVVVWQCSCCTIYTKLGLSSQSMVNYWCQTNFHLRIDTMLRLSDVVDHTCHISGQPFRYRHHGGSARGSLMSIPVFRRRRPRKLGVVPNYTHSNHRNEDCHHYYAKWSYKYNYIRLTSPAKRLYPTCRFGG